MRHWVCAMVLVLLAQPAMAQRARDLGLAFEGTADSTEEAIVNALIAARTMTGINGQRIIALPRDELLAILKQGHAAP